MILDPPDQRLKLPDGPSVEPRRLQQKCLGNVEVGERISKIMIDNFSRFFGAEEFHKL